MAIVSVNFSLVVTGLRERRIYNWIIGLQVLKSDEL